MLSLRDRAVIVFGGGSVGEMAARMCAALGARMIIVEKREARRKYLQKINLPRCPITENADRNILRHAHVIIGATYDREKTDRVVDEKMLKEISEIFAGLDRQHLEPGSARLLWQHLHPRPEYTINSPEVRFFRTVVYNN
jgi:D-arabinose 1-dehydrogenase-like Zn-dependent alcohol dehydrogenase